MPRRDRDDDDYDRPRRKAKKPSTGLIVGLAIGGGVAVLLLVGGCIALVWLGGKQPAADENKALIQAKGGKEGDARKTFTLEQWSAAIVGKTPEEVIAAIGRPDATIDDKQGRPDRWLYWSRVLNPATGKFDTGVIEFADGKVKLARRM